MPSAVWVELYAALCQNWPNIETLGHLCMPILSLMAYVSVPWLPDGQAKARALQRTRSLGHLILMSEWAVVALLCYIIIASMGYPFFKICQDLLLSARRVELVGVFCLAAGLYVIIPGL